VQSLNKIPTLVQVVFLRTKISISNTIFYRYLFPFSARISDTLIQIFFHHHSLHVATDSPHIFAIMSWTFGLVFYAISNQDNAKKVVISYAHIHSKPKVRSLPMNLISFGVLASEWNAEFKNMNRFSGECHYFLSKFTWGYLIVNFQS